MRSRSVYTYLLILKVQRLVAVERNSGDAADCSSPRSAARKLQLGAVPANHFSNRLANQFQ